LTEREGVAFVAVIGGREGRKGTSERERERECTFGRVNGSREQRKKERTGSSNICEQNKFDGVD
jgi:hypothetical protein